MCVGRSKRLDRKSPSELWMTARRCMLDA